MKQKWVAPICARLREPDLLQTDGCLFDLETGGMCCLGHITEVVRKEKFGMLQWKKNVNDKKSGRIVGIFEDGYGTLPTIIAKEIGIGDKRGIIELPKQWYTRKNEDKLYLTLLNDSGEFSLSQIADVIEYFWKEL